MSEEHKVIWLSPSCEDGERTWCSNDEWGECDECGAKPVKYVLAESAPADVEAKIQRLQDAKRRALSLADERAKENVALRAALASPASEGVRAAIIDECLNAARAGFEAAMRQYVLVGPSGMAMMMINYIKALPIAAPEPAEDEGPDPLGYAKGET